MDNAPLVWINQAVEISMEPKLRSTQGYRAVLLWVLEACILGNGYSHSASSNQFLGKPISFVCANGQVFINSLSR